MLIRLNSIPGGDLTEKGINISLVIKTAKNITHYDKASKAYKEAITKYNSGIYDRNVLDDVRLCLEQLLKDIFKNDKSLEKQREELGKYLKNKNVSGESIRIVDTLRDAFCKYQNHNVKHDDNVKEQEINFILEFASVLINFFAEIEK